MIETGDIVYNPNTDTVLSITDVQYVHNRYQAKNISGWQYDLDVLQKLDYATIEKLFKSLKCEKIKHAKALYKIAYLCADGTPLHEIAMQALKGENMSELYDLVYADEMKGAIKSEHSS